MPKRKELPGSNRRAPFAAERKPYPEDEWIEISLCLRPGIEARKFMEDLESATKRAKPEGKRKYLLDHYVHLDFEAHNEVFRADDDDCKVVADIAREFNLLPARSWHELDEWSFLDAADERTKPREHHREGHVVRLRGTVGDVEKLFQTDLNRRESEAGLHRWREGGLYPPEDLANVIEGAFGLDTRNLVEPLSSGCDAAAAHARSAWFDQVCWNYDLPKTTGAGERIGILEFGGGIHDENLRKYFGHLGRTFRRPRVVRLHAKNEPYASFRDDEEVALDVEVISTIAPDAETTLYFAPADSKGVVDALNYAVHGRGLRPHILCVAWGKTEEHWEGMWLRCANRILCEAAYRGITVCVATGDNGVALDEYGNRRVYFPASSPYVLACGGTAFLETSEVVWNEEGLYASGGGESRYIEKPPWQKDVEPTEARQGGQGEHIHSHHDSCSDRHHDSRSCSCGRHIEHGRLIPDVAALANRVYDIYADGAYVNATGGTSASAAVWAGLVARLNEALRHQQCRRVGYITPCLYLDSNLQTTGFNDICYGNNDPELIKGYEAVKGWDACTGWGSPKGKDLLSALMSLFRCVPGGTKK
jgi:kumamolisin